MSKEESKPDSIYTLPFMYDRDSQIIFDNKGNMALDVRGWGRLQYLPEGEEKQDAFGQYVTALLNSGLQKELSELRKENEDLKLKLSGKTFFDEKEVLESQLSKAKQLLTDASKRMTKAREILTERDGQPDCWQMLNSDKIESFLKS